MEKRLTKSECGVLYSKFLHSDRNIVDFCTENSIPYLQFADYINRHENRYGVTMVETAMERTELARYDPDSLNGREIPARGENLFQELALELDSSKFRSKARFPNNPSFQVELTAPKPDTIIRKAVLTLPSGIEVTLSQTGKEIRAKSLALLGILSTILIGLIGFCILLVHQGEWYTTLFYFVLYGIMSTGIVSFRLFKGIVYERSYKISGQEPNYILSDVAFDFAKKQGDLHKFLLAQQLNVISEKIEFNKRRNMQLQASFKLNMKLACFFICIAFILFLIYWITI